MDPRLGRHGVQPARLGKDVGHGCIRLRKSAITTLAGMLPMGVPVRMVA
ncbi:MAG: L,D-transpeptidase [Kineosporiaceae bacterium]